MSAELLSTCSASVCVSDAILALMSTWPAGMPGIVLSVQAGLRCSVQLRFGTTFLIMYGPTPGGRSVDWVVIFVPVGTRPADGKLSTFRNAPYGCVSWIVILPLLSSVW